MTDYLFVYGTLNPKEGVLQALGIDHEVIGRGKVKGKLLSKTEYPAVVPTDSEDSKTISGIVIKLFHPQKAWYKLDSYEEFFPKKISDSLYVRKKIKVIMNNKQTKLCWIYYYNIEK